MGFRPRVAFAGADTFKIDVYLAELAIQHLTWRTEVVEELLGSVFWAKLFFLTLSVQRLSRTL